MDQSDAPGTGGPPPQAAAVRRSPRWMRALLIVSLAINLLVAGWGIAQVVRGPGFVSAGPAASFADARKLYWALPRERRETLRERFIDGHRREFVERRRDWHAARDRLAEVLADDDASEGEIRAAYQALGRTEAEASQRWREILADITVLLTHEERETYAERFGRRWAHHR